MYKHFVLAVSLAAVCTVSTAQTKRIAHRSHSGSNASFSTKGADNFGLPPDYKRKQTKDTIKLAPASKTDTTQKKAQPANKERPKKKPATKKKTTVSNSQ